MGGDWMSKYKVLVIETLSREIVIDAENEDVARDIVEQMYLNEEVVLDASDFREYELYGHGEVKEEDEDDK